MKAKNFNNINVIGIPITAAKVYARSLWSPRTLKIKMTTTFWIIKFGIYDTANFENFLKDNLYLKVIKLFNMYAIMSPEI